MYRQIIFIYKTKTKQMRLLTSQMFLLACNEIKKIRNRDLVSCFLWENDPCNLREEISTMSHTRLIFAKMQKFAIKKKK